MMRVELVRLSDGMERTVKAETTRMDATLASLTHVKDHNKATDTVLLRALPGVAGMVQVPVYVTYARADVRVRRG